MKAFESYLDYIGRIESGQQTVFKIVMILKH